MKRAEIWTVAGGPDYAGKPRPAVILQDDAFDGTGSITLCPFTTYLVDAPLIRLPVEPSTKNGLQAASHLMVDKITTVARSKLQKRIVRSETRNRSLERCGLGVPWTRRTFERIGSLRACR
jgi:mRNA interferase MazF